MIVHIHTKATVEDIGNRQHHHVPECENGDIGAEVDRRINSTLLGELYLSENA